MKLKSSTYQLIGTTLLALGTMGVGMSMGYGWRNDNASISIYHIIPLLTLALSVYLTSKAKKMVVDENTEVEIISPLMKKITQLFIVVQSFSLGFYIGYKTVHENFSLPSYVYGFFYITPLFLVILTKKKKTNS